MNKTWNASTHFDALLQNEQRFDALVSGVEDCAIFLLSSKGHIISWNAGAERIKGYKPKEIIGKHFSIFYTPEAREGDRPRAILHAAAKEGRCVDEGWRLGKDGSQFWASVVVTALKTQTGALRGFLKITRLCASSLIPLQRDPTERRKIDTRRGRPEASIKTPNPQNQQLSNAQLAPES